MILYISTTSSVLIAMAMEAEAAPVVTKLGLISDTTFFPSKTPFKAYRGSYKGCNLVVVTNGKDHVHGTGVDNCGTVPASLCTFLALERDTFDVVINAGTL
jgi:nucleoside phosphorylase